jgi:hypothetical protein
MCPTLCFVLVAFGCAWSRQADAALVVVEGAINIRSERGFGSDGVEYDVPGGDAKQIVTTIAARLRDDGWEPLAQLWDHRVGESTSFSNGWMCFPSQVQSPDSALRFQWIADWRNASGDIVTYIVGCAAPPDQCNYVDVSASIVSADEIGDDPSNTAIKGQPN